MNEWPSQNMDLKEKKTTYQMTLWMILLSCLLTGGTLLVLRGIWKEQIGYFWVQILIAIIGVGCCVWFYHIGQRIRYAGLILLLPWPVMFGLSGFHGYVSGLIAWVDLLIVRWNAVHEQDIALISSDATQHDLWACTLMCALLYSEIVGLIVGARKKWLCCLYMLTWILVQLVSGDFSPLSCGMLMVGFLGVLVSDVRLRINERGILWLIAITAVLVVCMSVTGDQESVAMTEVRGQIENGIKTLRYGQPQLPEGKVNQADKLKENTENQRLMTVRSEQVKTLYLKSFSGGQYKDGCWKPLSNTDFGGDYAGMLDWLQEYDFDPLTQSALYYRLCSGTNLPETNQIKVSIDQAFRRPVYSPASLDYIEESNIRENKDSGIVSRGLTGIHRYTMEELSDIRPSELIVSEDWLDSPENDAQTQYVTAEAVYREFVYTHYLTLDETTEKLMQQLFWNDYDTENDGIYRAVCQIRSKLEELVNYVDLPEKAPDGQDPIRWFLTRSRSGNAVQYASAAVEALRAHGIPARYAEGYYIADSDFGASDNGMVDVQPRNAHAWVEVYFDGIGWLPVEVTPGFYYDTVSLSQMVNTSNVVRKTAALDDDTSKAQPIISGGGDDEAQQLLAPLRMMKDMLLVVLGIVVLLLLILAVMFAILEIARLVFIFKDKAALDASDGMDAVQKIMEAVFYLLHLRGIEAHFGWEAKKVDDKLAERIENVKNGDFVRVSTILEKAIYGGDRLEAYEMRTLKYFLQELAVPEKKAGWKLKLKLRYASLALRWHKA